jgi:hypothetical protein
MDGLELISDPNTGGYTLLKKYRATDGNQRVIAVGLGNNEAITRWLAHINSEIAHQPIAE